MARADAVAASTAWFERLALPLTAGDRAAAAAYAQALGLAHTGVRTVGGAEAAARVMRDPAWDRHWWELEERERESLMQRAQARLGTDAVLDALSAALEPHTEPSLQQALRAPALAAAGEALARVASGALLMALHCEALARLCGCGDDHLFMRKCRLFSRGRWPLGVRDATLVLF